MGWLRYCDREVRPNFVISMQTEFTLFHWKDTDVEKNMKVEGTTYSKIPSIFDHMVHNSSTIESNYHLGHVKFVEEKVSTKVSWRKRKIAEILENCKPGDSIIVSELSRLGRSMLECMEILSIATERGINIYAVKGNWQLDGSIQSRIIAMAFSMAAEIERDLISKRTKEALQAKKQQGLPLGRPRGVGKSKLDPFRPEIEALLNNGSTKTFIAKRYKTSEANLHHWLKLRSIQKQKPPV